MILGPYRNEIAGLWRKLCNEGLHGSVLNQTGGIKSETLEISGRRWDESEESGCDGISL